MSRNIILEVVNWTFSISQVIDSIIVASIAIFVITEIDGITIATTTVGIIIIVAATATGDHDQEAIHAREAHTIDAMIVIHRQSLHHLHHKTHPNHLMLAQRKINKLAFIAFIFFPEIEYYYCYYNIKLYEMFHLYFEWWFSQFFFLWCFN